MRQSFHSPAAIAFVVALLLRIVYVLDLRRLPLFDRPIMDEQIHDGWARGTLDFLWRDVPYFRAPLYPWFLETIYALNDGYLFVRIVQAVLSALIVALVADMGRRLGGNKAGLFSGLLLAMCWPAVYFSGELLIVTFVTALGFTSLWMLMIAAEKDLPWMALAAALVLGIASMARPTVLAFLPMILWLPLRTWPRMDLECLQRRSRWMALGMLGLALLPPGLLTVRNATVGHDLVFVASQGGVNFYIGNNPQSDGRTAVVPGTRPSWLGGFEDTARIAQNAEGRPLRASEVSRYWFQRGLTWLAEDPAGAARLYARKLRLLLGAGERSNNKNLHFWREQSRVLKWPIYSSWAPIFALGAVGLWSQRRRSEAAPLMGFLLLYSAGVLLFFVNERFRHPVLVGWAVFAGIPLARLVENWASRQRQAALRIMIGVGIIFGASQLDRVSFLENHTDKDPFSRVTLGNAWMSHEEPAKALAAYDEAESLAVRWGVVGFEQVEHTLHLKRAIAYRQLRRWEEAAAELRWLQAKFPNMPELRREAAMLERARQASP